MESSTKKGGSVKVLSGGQTNEARGQTAIYLMLRHPIWIGLGDRGGEGIQERQGTRDR